MDNEDLKHLEGLITSLKEDLVGRIDSLERLTMDVKESLEREMREGFAQVNARFDTHAARLDRQGGFVQSGSRWSTRMDEWSEKIDVNQDRQDQAIAEMRENLRRLEARLDK